MSASRKAAVANAASTKSLTELFMDPHFVFTVLSLCLSVSVFFYYLWQLLCNRDEEEKDERAREQRDAMLRRRLSGEVPMDQRTQQLLNERVAEAAERLEAKRRQDEQLQRLRRGLDSLESSRRNDAASSPGGMSPWAGRSPGVTPKAGTSPAAAKSGQSAPPTQRRGDPTPDANENEGGEDDKGVKEAHRAQLRRRNVAPPEADADLPAAKKKENGDETTAGAGATSTDAPPGTKADGGRRKKNKKH